ncbi:hypothetical protein [Bifidobacterium aquikefiricola]|uniref:CtkA family protein n=1 Tax=Bifidobacterium aquikefiricola TaxID=3059038 RepID=A0AB39U5E5_9BIFI
MVTIVDFEGAELSDRFYAGDAGRKVGVVWHGVDWMLKYPGPTRHLEGSVPSYTSAPLSEFLGSHVYALLGIPVHETLLGIRGGLVCACRDFETDDRHLVEFRSLKNSLSDDEPGFTEAPSSGRSVVLADVRSALHRIPLLDRIAGVTKRFWDMFVTDAFIRNVDRNNTNWGILTGGGKPELAPVYDNGSSFFNKRTEKAIAARLKDPDLLRQDALDVRSCYVDDRGKPISPLKYMTSGQDKECSKALERFMQRWEPAKFDALLDAVPTQSMGVSIMSDEYHEYHRLVLSVRYQHAFIPAWNAVKTTLENRTND